MQKKFKKGDRVVIREWDDMASEFGVYDSTGSIKCHASFVKDMKYLCGKTAVIEYVDLSTKVLKLSFEEVVSLRQWSLSTDMIRHVSGATQPNPVWISNLGDILRGHIKSQIEKETTMSVNTRVLARMADKKYEEDLVKAGAAGLPPNILEALKKKQVEKQEAAAAAAADEIMALLDLQERHIDFHVNKVRDARKVVEQSKKVLDGIARAKAYGVETGNFLPLALMLDEYVPGELRELAKIPADWSPSDEEVK